MQSSFIARAIRITTAARLTAVVVLGGTAMLGCSDDTAGTTTPRAVTTYGGGDQTGTVATTLTAPLVVLVSDGDSHGVAGVQVSFTVTGGATLSSATATSDANGLAQVTITLGTKAGFDSVTATVANVVTPPAIFALPVNPGAPSAIAAESGNNVTTTAGSIVTLAALVTDQYGNPVPNATIDWSATAGTIAAVETSDNTGTAEDVLQLPNAPATVTATATVDGTQIKTSFVDTVH